jgi:nitroreductase
MRVSAPFDTEITDRLLSTTRAVRKRLDLDREVPREVILDCLRLAQQAPTGSNAQGWRFVVVTDAAKRARLAQIYREVGSEYLSNAGQMDAQLTRVRTSSRYLLDAIDRVPVLVIPCINGRVRDPARAAGFYGSILPAVWSFMLALRSRGLGSVWTTFTLAREQEVADLLGIPDDVTQVAMIPVAYTIGTEFKPATRPPAEQITYWDSWGD